MRARRMETPASLLTIFLLPHRFGSACRLHVGGEMAVREVARDGIGGKASHGSTLRAAPCFRNAAVSTESGSYLKSQRNQSPGGPAAASSISNSSAAGHCLSSAPPRNGYRVLSAQRGVAASMASLPKGVGSSQVERSVHGRQSSCSWSDCRSYVRQSPRPPLPQSSISVWVSIHRWSRPTAAAQR